MSENQSRVRDFLDAVIYVVIAGVWAVFSTGLGLPDVISWTPVVVAFIVAMLTLRKM